MSTNYKMRAEMWISLPLIETFAFFEDPGNLAKITPSWLNFQVDSPGNVEIRTGAEIDYTIRWLGVPLWWKTLIRDYRPPEFFSDEQLRGPYRFWLHQHTFQSVDGGTKVTDLVRYRLPFGPLAEIGHPLVRKQLLGIFRFRQARIGELLKAKTRQVFAPEITIDEMQERP